MSTHKHFDKIAIIVTIIMILGTILFMNGEALGIEVVRDEDAEQNSDSQYFTSNDQDGSWDASNAVMITLADDDTKIVGNGAYYNDGDVTITGAGYYVLTGELTDGSVIVDAYDSSKVWLLLDGVTLNCSDDACIRVDQSDKVFLTLAEGTENSIASGESYSEEAIADGTGGAIYAHDDLTINGSGSLEVTAEYMHGIEANDDMVITGGTISIQAPGDGIHANDSLRVMQASVTIDAGDDGIDLDGKDGVTAGAESGYFYVESGKLDVTSADDGLHIAGDITVAGGNITVSAGDDAIHSETAFAMTDGNIYVAECYEGIEAITIDIAGGTTTIYCSDDGLNANGGSGTAFGMGGGMGGQMQGQMQQPPQMPEGMDGQTQDQTSEGTSATGQQQMQKPPQMPEGMDGQTQDQTSEGTSTTGQQQMQQPPQMPEGMDGQTQDQTSGGTSTTGQQQMQQPPQMPEGMAGEAGMNGETVANSEAPIGEAMGTAAADATADATVASDMAATGQQQMRQPPQMPEGMAGEAGMNGEAASGEAAGTVAADDTADVTSANDTATASDETWIRISGGELTIINTNGRDADGIDSNGDIYLEGGTVRVSVEGTSGGNSAIDYASESGANVYINGGTLVACGGSSMVEEYSDDSEQVSILCNLSETIPAGSTVQLLNAAGEEILSYTPECAFSSIGISSSELAIGETYTLVTGDVTTEITPSETSHTEGGTSGMGGAMGGRQTQGGMNGQMDGKMGQVPGQMNGETSVGTTSESAASADAAVDADAAARTDETADAVNAEGAMTEESITIQGDMSQQPQGAMNGQMGDRTEQQTEQEVETDLETEVVQEQANAAADPTNWAYAGVSAALLAASLLIAKKYKRNM